MKLRNLWLLAACAFSLNARGADFGTDKIGVVSSFNAARNSGYVEPSMGGEALYFRGSEARGIRDLHDGTCVRYDIKEFSDHHVEAVHLQEASCY